MSGIKDKDLKGDLKYIIVSFSWGDIALDSYCYKSSSVR